MNHEECIHYEICDRFLHWRFHEIKECERFMEKPKKGEWIETDNRWGVGAWECSVCTMYTIQRFAFCPHCGARMKEGDEK